MKRREFVKKGSVLSAGFLFGGTVLASEFSNNFMKRNIRLAIIGSGSRGVGLIPVVKSVEGIDLVALCDVLEFRLVNGLAKTDGTVKGYSDYREILKNKKIDAVLIATPFYTHEKIAMDAIEAGKHVYCEKTTAKGIDGIKSLAKKLEDSKLIFQTGHQYHSSRLYQKVVEIIKSKEIGEISSFECQWYRKGDWRKPVPKPSLERSINWRMYREYSGGLTAELSSHQIDFVNWVLAENPKKIMGTGGIDFYHDGRETYDNTHLLFEYPSGVKASFKCLTGNIPGGYEIKVIGRKGIITIGPNSAWIKYYSKTQKPSIGLLDGVSGATKSYGSGIDKGQKLNISHMEPTKQALFDFKEAIANNTQPISNIYTGGHTAIAVQMSLDAMYTGTTQYWKEEYNLI